MAPWKPPVLRLAMTLVPRPRRCDAPTTAMLLGASSVAMASMDIPERTSSKGNLRISIYGAVHNRLCLHNASWRTEMSYRPVHSTVVGATVSAMFLAATVATAIADPVTEFYKGRTISLIIASGEGGGYDISGRLTAEFLSKYIPGHPAIIARNMPGASGM